MSSRGKLGATDRSAGEVLDRHRITLGQRVVLRDEEDTRLAGKNRSDGHIVVREREPRGEHVDLIPTQRG
jgi:hypothetical protein